MPFIASFSHNILICLLPLDPILDLVTTQLSSKKLFELIVFYMYLKTGLLLTTLSFYTTIYNLMAFYKRAFKAEYYHITMYANYGKECPEI